MVINKFYGAVAGDYLIVLGLLVFFRDKGLGVPSIALFLDLFSVSAPMIILDLPSSHKFGKERYFFVSGRSWEYDPLDEEDTLGILAIWTTLENLREL